MYRFLAVFRHNETSQIEKIRTPVIEEILNRFPGFQVVDEDSDLLILHWKDDRIGMDTHRLSEKRGTILGHIFTPKPDGGDVIDCLRPPLMFSQMESDAIQGSSGKHLIDNYWGNYVAFIRGGLNKELLVIRSPFSTIQCYHFSIDGYSIIFSDFYLVSILKKFGTELDWSFVPLYVKYYFTYETKTAFKNIEQVHASQCLRITKKTHSIFYLWEPENCALKEFNGSIDDTAAKLRNITLSCFKAWSSKFSCAVVDISGGFDSSLVAGLFGAIKGSPKLLCLTRYDNTPLVDERAYVHKTVKKWGHDLFEVAVDPFATNFERYFIKAFTPLPILVDNNWQTHIEELKYIVKYGAQVKFTGHGGDALFEMGRNNIAARDYIFDQGIGLEFIKVAMRSALRSDWTFWRSLYDALYFRCNSAQAFPEHKMNKGDGCIDYAEWGLHPDLKEKFSDYVVAGPWLHNKKLSLGKKEKLSLAMFPSVRFHIMRDLPFIQHIDPLLSQPIVEACLQIPSYIHLFNGRERGLARHAFGEFLADEIRLRQFKSNGSPPEIDRVRTYRKFHADYLLDGVLAGKNILDTELIEKTLLDPSIGTPEVYNKITHLANVEAWARSWV